MSLIEVLETLLKERGITEKNKQDFLNPDYSKLHDPLLLKDMEIARDRVIKAMKNGERIFVFSDYDADGIPGAVVLSDFFRRAKYENVSFYIPHRHDEGFGLNKEAIDKAVEEGAKLLITIDCGTADAEEILHANKGGLDVIVTDHHEAKKLPKALAIVNPKVKPRGKEKPYPFQELCGAAVAFKLVQAILLKESFGIKPGMEKWSLDMVAIATLSDLVSLVGENRILAKFGLEVLRKSPRPGIQALCQKLRMNQRYLSEDDIAFMITPRINAASRMGHPMDAFKLLSTDDPEEALRLALYLEEINKERKGAVATMVKDAKKRLKEREEIPNVIVIGHPDWRPALVGLVANSMVEEYLRPVFVWGRDGDGVIKGSCRTYNGYNLFDLMHEVEESFLAFGGHAGAGGFSISLEKLAQLEDKLSKALDKFESEKKEKVAGMSMSTSYIGEDLWQTLNSLAPFGVGNPKPVFDIECDVGEVRSFGKNKEHLELKLSSGHKAISFFSPLDRFGELREGKRINLKAHLEKSYFLGRPEIRLRIIGVENRG